MSLLVSGHLCYSCKYILSITWYSCGFACCKTRFWWVIPCPFAWRLLNEIVDHVIGPRGLLSTKARILVTNSIAFLKHMDKIVYLRRGIIIESGSYNELMLNQESHVSNLV